MTDSKIKDEQNIKIDTFCFDTFCCMGWKRISDPDDEQTMCRRRKPFKAARLAEGLRY